MFADSWQKSKAVANSIGKKLDVAYIEVMLVVTLKMRMRKNVYYAYIDHRVQQFSCKVFFSWYNLLPSKLPTLINSEVDTIKKYYGPAGNHFKEKLRSGKLSTVLELQKILMH